MRRFLQVLTLGAAALLFTTAGPGLAAADQGRGGGNFKNAPLDKPLYKAHKGHRKFGQDRRHGKRHVGEKRRRHHARDHRRNHRQDHARRGHKHRHYGHRHRRHDRWHRRYGHRRHHGVWPFIGLHVYRSYEAPPPPAYLPPPPAYPVQPAPAEQKVADAGPHATCLMTREYQTEILVGGELVPAYGQACLQPDGSWYRGPAVPAHN